MAFPLWVKFPSIRAIQFLKMRMKMMLEKVQLEKDLFLIRLWKAYLTRIQNFNKVTMKFCMFLKSLHYTLAQSKNLCKKLETSSDSNKHLRHQGNLKMRDLKKLAVITRIRKVVETLSEKGFTCKMLIKIVVSVRQAILKLI